ncbi:E1 [Camelus dromedarius papillomavirus 2]|uniref:Replication protein E1 n=1 Tax=Camelus dromedarius papillomavirus 2 TaxID=996651 RepID=F2YGH8_9PAPI|nr:E1 [Camelus dromedarius papillomavirus 2]ADZ53058.1 E1 [Camelus dromedarius papillomavirus 2]
MAAAEGSDCKGGGACFLDLEAECSESETTSTSYIGSEPDGSEGEDFVDNASVHSEAQGNHRALFQTLVKKAGNRHVKNLKRKLNVSCESDSQDVEQSSPSLASSQAASPLGSRPAAKRRLFAALENTPAFASCSYEASGDSSQQVPSPGYSENSEGSSRHGRKRRCPASNGSKQSSKENKRDSQLHLEVLVAKNKLACKMAYFKHSYTVSYTDLTRVFHSDRTTNNQWVVAAFGVTDAAYEAAIEKLPKICVYLQASRRSRKKGNVALFLLDFTVAKCRDTVMKLFQDMLNVKPEHLLCQPPKMKGVCAALFWFKNAIATGTATYGAVPAWIRSQTSLSEATAEQSKFDFGTMVQWAWDNQLCEESVIAYQYALCAETDLNAKAWLASSNQARVVKDVAVMVRHYKRAAMLGMSISAYIKHRCDGVADTGSWLSVMNVLKYQGISPIEFVNAMKLWLKGVPKKNTIALIGPANTGKSMFSNSLLGFLGGQVLSFQNHHSHFWLAPLADTRAALIDDATFTCWKYVDIYLRNVLDGYSIQIDRKHRQPVQMKAPPLLITSNVDVTQEPQFQYLYSRLVIFYFKQPFPLDEHGDPVFQITYGDWKSFFERLWGRLDLSDQEDEGDDGDGVRTFKCNAKQANGTY